MSIRPSVRPCVCTSTIKYNAAKNQVVEFVRVDETFTTIWLSRSSEVRVKVMWDLKFQKWRFSKYISSAIFQPIKKISTVSKIFRAWFLNFVLFMESRDFKVCQKSTSSDLNETWYNVRGRRVIHDDMTFEVIRGQGQAEEMTSVPYRDYFLWIIHSFLLYWRWLFVCRYQHQPRFADSRQCHQCTQWGKKERTHPLPGEQTHSTTARCLCICLRCVPLSPSFLGTNLIRGKNAWFHGRLFKMCHISWQFTEGVANDVKLSMAK